MQFKSISEDDFPVLAACLSVIHKELVHQLYRNHWSRTYQIEYDPFSYTKSEFLTPTFQVRSYKVTKVAISDNLEEVANFSYQGLRVWWKRYCEDIIQATIDEPLTVRFLAGMIQDCKTAISNEFAR